MSAPAPTIPRKPWFYSRATVEILLYALAEAEAAQAKKQDTSYSMVRR